VLILPPGHARTIRAPRRFSRREKWILTTVAASVVAVIVAIVISIGTGGGSTPSGCVDVKFSTTIGAGEIYQCGGKARTLCASASAGGGISSVERPAVIAACRKAGLGVG
jgi:hypothetical protein